MPIFARFQPSPAYVCFIQITTSRPLIYNVLGM